MNSGVKGEHSLNLNKRHPCGLHLFSVMQLIFKLKARVEKWRDMLAEFRNFSFGNFPFSLHIDAIESLVPPFCHPAAMLGSCPVICRLWNCK